MIEILVIDDTEEVRRFFRVVLEQAGYAVREASSGSEGIRLFRESPSDIVITDMYMPNGDGFDVLRTLRGEALLPKIIVLSGQLGQTEMLSAAKFMGADLVLPKPVAIDALLKAVKTVADPFRP